MTKKDYVAVASVLYWQGREIEQHSNKRQVRVLMGYHVYLVKSLALRFKHDNEQFDSKRFLTACGIDRERE